MRPACVRWRVLGFRWAMCEKVAQSPHVRDAAGIRDEGLLDSAINKPKNLFDYGNPNAFELAASYATGLVKNHPFLDGNKRIGFMAAYVFLGANGWRLEATEEEAVTKP